VSTDSPSQSSSELRQFHTFVATQLARSDGEDLSPEDVIDLWREQHPCSEDTASTVTALRAALADIEAGDLGIPLDEYDRQFRARHGLPPPA
jgi:hypothetical protein